MCFFPNKKDCQNDIHIHHTHPTYLDLSGILIHCIYTYIDIVLECFGYIPHSFEKQFLVWKIVVDLRSPCATIRRQMALGTQARHDAGDEGIYIYTFVHDFYVLIQSSF